MTAQTRGTVRCHGQHVGRRKKAAATVLGRDEVSCLDSLELMIEARDQGIIDQTMAGKQLLRVTPLQPQITIHLEHSSLVCLRNDGRVHALDGHCIRQRYNCARFVYILRPRINAAC